MKFPHPIELPGTVFQEIGIGRPELFDHGIEHFPGNSELDRLGQPIDPYVNPFVLLFHPTKLRNSFRACRDCRELAQEAVGFVEEEGEIRNRYSTRKPTDGNVSPE